MYWCRYRRLPVDEPRTTRPISRALLVSLRNIGHYSFVDAGGTALKLERFQQPRVSQDLRLIEPDCPFRRQTNCILATFGAKVQVDHAIELSGFADAAYLASRV